MTQKLNAPFIESVVKSDSLTCHQYDIAGYLAQSCLLKDRITDVKRENIWEAYVYPSYKCDGEIDYKRVNCIITPQKGIIQKIIFNPENSLSSSGAPISFLDYRNGKYGDTILNFNAGFKGTIASEPELNCFLSNYSFKEYSKRDDNFNCSWSAMKEYVTGLFAHKVSWIGMFCPREISFSIKE